MSRGKVIALAAAERDLQSMRALVELCASARPKVTPGSFRRLVNLVPAAFTLWSRFLVFDPDDPQWPDRDRFVLSKGHAAPLLYALLCASGYDLRMDEIRAFATKGSRTPSHPERGVTPGVEVTTGVLGQGLGNAVGMAWAERYLADGLNRPEHRIVNHRTYCIVSDGDLMEGAAAEAAAIAGHYGLGKLICLYDANGTTKDGPLTNCACDDVAARFRASNWHTEEADGGGLEDIELALTRAVEDPRPSLVVLHTAEVARQFLDGDGGLRWKMAETPIAPALVDAGRAGAELRDQWGAAFHAYRRIHPTLAAVLEGGAPVQPNRGNSVGPWPVFTPGRRIATRVASAVVLRRVTGVRGDIVAGSADLGAVTKLCDSVALCPWNAEATRYINFGVREIGMGAVLNGIAAHGLRAVGSTFLVFADHLLPAMRLAALMNLPVCLVFTHDSIALGEDGPTHQPVEQLATLRGIPRLVVLRPADANETTGAWRVALSRTDGPSALVLSRQDLPVLEATRAEAVARGGYIVSESSRPPDAVLVATGSEVHIALGAAEQLDQQGINVQVVSMPSCELFDGQTQDYRDEVLPPEVPVIVVEAALPTPWWRYVRREGDVVGMEDFGMSAPGPRLLEDFGFTVPAVADRVRRVVDRDVFNR